MYEDPSGHGTTSATDKWIEAGADPETAQLAAELYPGAQDLSPYYDKYRNLGHNASDAVTLARQEILYGSAVAESLSQNNYKRYEGTGVATSGYSEWYQNINHSQSNGGSAKTGNRFPEKPYDLFPENYVGLEIKEKLDGKIDFIVQAGNKTYKVEYHPKHTDGNHYHVLKRGEYSKPRKTTPPFFRIPNLDPDTPAQGGTFAPGDLLPTKTSHTEKVC